LANPTTASPKSFDFDLDLDLDFYARQQESPLRLAKMVYYFTSNTVTPSAFIYVGKDKVESMPPNLNL
jgi:hypothetical protein